MSSDRLQRVLAATETIPQHVAIIMDGNGRWAGERGLARYEGHRAGMKAVRDTVEGAIEAGVSVLTLFAFSHENWRRPKREIAFLMTLLQRYAGSQAQDLADNGVEVHVVGDIERLNPGGQAAIRTIKEKTRGGDRLQLVLAISYGGRGELVRVASRLAARALAGELQPDEIDEDSFAKELFTAAWPDPDLLIRTSGEYRISNFMLWQIAYTELYSTQVLWPDFGREELFEAILDYQQRERRFGRVSV